MVGCRRRARPAPALGYMLFAIEQHGLGVQQRAIAFGRPQPAAVRSSVYTGGRRHVVYLVFSSLLMLCCCWRGAAMRLSLPLPLALLLLFYYIYICIGIV